MGLRAKFNLVMFVVFALGLAGAGFAGHRILLGNAEEEVLQDARVLMDTALAIRDYTVTEIRPLIQKAGHDVFLPQTVPAYAATANIRRLKKKYNDYSYKEATLNPTNPENKAADWELDLVSYFRDHADTKEFYGVRATPTGESLYLSRPIRISKPGCLACHGDAQSAPKTLLAKYGTGNGFGWKLNSIVGAQVVSVPMSLPVARAQKAFAIFMAMLAGVFISIWLVLNILLHFVIVKRVVAMSRLASDISTGKATTGELAAKGNDEINQLARSFNRMQRSLSNAVKMLETSRAR